MFYLDTPDKDAPRGPKLTFKELTVNGVTQTDPSAYLVSSESNSIDLNSVKVSVNYSQYLTLYNQISVTFEVVYPDKLDEPETIIITS